jgi:exonuclease VII large subunit
MVDAGFVPMWVRGEVTGFRAYQSGHWYFDLKDETAKVRCTMWKTAAQRCPERPADGAEVFVLGKPAIWEEKGEFSFGVQKLLLTNRVGQQQQELERVKAALARDGCSIGTQRSLRPSRHHRSGASPTARPCATSSAWRGSAGPQCGCCWYPLACRAPRRGRSWCGRCSW